MINLIININLVKKEGSKFELVYAYTCIVVYVMEHVTVSPSFSQDKTSGSHFIRKWVVELSV